MRACDIASLGAWIEGHRLCLDAEEPGQTLALDLACTQHRLLSGDADVADLAAGLSAEADRLADPHIALDARSLEALAALHEGDLERATDRARRAARMARAEGESEFFTSLVLARVRRASAPYLTLRILMSLTEVAPAVGGPWVAYEVAMAGEPERARALLGETRGSLLADTVHCLADLLISARGGDRDAFDGAAKSLRRGLEGVPWLAREADELICSLDPGVELASLSGALYSFCAGDTSEPPFAIRGFSSGRTNVCHVVKSPRRPARRVLSAGLPLMTVAPSGERPASSTRANTALAVLMLAGRDGLTDAEFFEATYGFPFKARIHRGQLDVLKHRIRGGLGTEIVLRRVGDRNVLDGIEHFAVPDPRCAQPAGDRALRALAGGRATARELADRMDVALRTAQGILRELVEEGACVVHKEGRAVSYTVEDTSFSEPTRY